MRHMLLARIIIIRGPIPQIEIALPQRRQTMQLVKHRERKRPRLSLSTKDASTGRKEVPPRGVGGIGFRDGVDGFGGVREEGGRGEGWRVLD